MELEQVELDEKMIVYYKHSKYIINKKNEVYHIADISRYLTEVCTEHSGYVLAQLTVELLLKGNLDSALAVLKSIINNRASGGGKEDKEEKKERENQVDKR